MLPVKQRGHSDRFGFDFGCINATVRPDSKWYRAKKSEAATPLRPRGLAPISPPMVSPGEIGTERDDIGRRNCGNGCKNATVDNEKIS